MRDRGPPTAAAPATELEEPALAEDEALLIVDVVSIQTNEPVAGVRVSLLPKRDGVEPPDGDYLNWGTTDANGRVALVVVGSGAHTLLVPSWPSDVVEIDVPAMATGDHRRVEARVRSRIDYVFHARIVDAATGAPVPDAVVRVEQDSDPAFDAGEAPEMRVDALARLRLPASSEEELILGATAPGYVVQYFKTRPRHDSVDRELAVALERPATLECRVLARGRVVAGATVRVRTYGFHVVQSGDLAVFGTGSGRAWTAISSLDGLARFDELPTGEALRVSVDRDGYPTRKLPEDLELEPSEARRLELELEPPGAIAGRVVRSDGSSIANAAIWLVEPDDCEDGFIETERPFVAATTDDDGHFRFEHVPAGVWRVGAAPGELAPLAERVEVATSEVQVEIRTDTGLYIEGRVVGPHGEPVADAEVRATRRAADAKRYASTDVEGDFRIGPLVAGTWEITAVESDAELVSEDLPPVAAGATDVVVRVVEGGVIRGSAADSEGNVARNASIYWTRADGNELTEGNCGASPVRRGRFEARGLRPGRYSIAVSTARGQFGWVEGIAVSAGAGVDDVGITVEPAARLRVSNGDDVYVTAVSTRKGALLSYVTLDRHERAEIVVPPGELTLMVNWDDDLPAREQTFTIARGEPKEIVLERSP